MKEGDKIVEMTPFLFEDGKMYYFEITKGYSNNYHKLSVFNKNEIVLERKTWFGLGPTEKNTTFEYLPINKDGALVNTNLKSDEVKREIKNIIYANRAITKIDGWDGFVGDIPNDVKTSLLREAKLKNLGINE